jgi:hypothetical protein
VLNTELAERVLRVLGVTTPEQQLHVRTTALTLTSDALEITSHRIAKEDGYEGLQKDFAVTPTAGAIDLTAIDTLIFDIARSRVRETGTNLPLRAVDSLETLVHGGLQTDKAAYAQDGAELRFRDLNGALGSYATPVKIKANYVLTLDDVPGSYEATLVQTLAGLVGSQTGEVRSSEQAANTRA